MKCVHQKVSKEVCPSGFSQKISCEKVADLETPIECMNQCNQKCPLFQPVEKRRLTGDGRRQSSGGYTVDSAGVRNAGSGCGGCGQNKPPEEPQNRSW
jgi:hypothetical protein